MPSVRVLALIITLMDPFAIGIVNPIVPQLMQAERIGASAFGVIMSLANLASCFAGTVYGRVSDRHGRRLPIVAAILTALLGYSLYALGLALEGVSPLGRLVLPPLGRILSGVGRTGLNGPLLALQAERDPERAKGTVAGHMATFGIGYSLGSAAGAVLQHGAEAHTAGGAWINLAAMLACVLVQLACSLLLPHALPAAAKASASPADCAARGASEASPAESINKEADASILRALREGLRDPATRVLILLECMFSAQFHLYDSTSALYLLSHLGFTKAERGYLLAYAGLVYAANLALLGRRRAHVEKERPPWGPDRR